MEEKVKKKVQQQRDEARKTEQQLQRDQAVALKQRQRLEIYALNKVMTEFEWMNFKEFMKNMDGKSPWKTVDIAIWELVSFCKC